MSLDVWIIAPPLPGEKRKAYRQRVAALEWDGYYHYLSRFWPASSSTGRIIDLYDSTHFEGANLKQLRGCLLKARESLEGQPKSWKERIGIQTRPVRGPMLAGVERAKLEALIGDLLKAVAVAEERSGRVAFEGD